MKTHIKKLQYVIEQFINNMKSNILTFIQDWNQILFEGDKK
jgi:hypothetical protein